MKVTELILFVFINLYSIIAYKSIFLDKNSFIIRNLNKNNNNRYFLSKSSSDDTEIPINMETDEGILDLADFGIDFPELSTDVSDTNVVDSTTLSMQEALWDELRGENEYVTKDVLKNWDEIQDFKDRGIMDDYTLDIIMKEVGLQSNENELSFAQCIEAIDLINSVALALDQADFNSEEEDYIETEEADVNPMASTEWMLNAMNLDNFTTKNKKDLN